MDACFSADSMIAQLKQLLIHSILVIIPLVYAFKWDQTGHRTGELSVWGQGWIKPLRTWSQRHWPLVAEMHRKGCKAPIKVEMKTKKKAASCCKHCNNVVLCYENLQYLCLFIISLSSSVPLLVILLLLV